MNSSAHRSIGIALFIVAVVGLPTLAVPPGPDQSTFLLVADAWFHGHLPYRDVWDIKSPGTFMLYGAARALLGPGFWPGRLLDVGWTLATGLALYAFARRYLSATAGAWAAALYGIHALIQSPWELGQTDAMTALPVLMSVVWLTDAARAASRAETARATAFASGLALGFAFLLKLPVVCFAPVLLGILALEGGLRQQLSPSHMRIVAFTSIGLTVWPLLTVTYFGATGALPDLLETLFVWAPRYAFSGSLPEWLYGGIVLGSRNLWAIPLLAVGAIGAVVHDAAIDRLKRLTVPLLLLAGAGLMIGLQGKFYRYHWMAGWPYLALLAGHGLSLTLERIAQIDASSRRRLATCALVAAIGVSVPLDLARPLSTTRWIFRWKRGVLDDAGFYRQFSREEPPNAYRFVDDFETGRYLRDHTVPGASIFVWGFDPAIYLVAERSPASRFIYHFPVAARWTPPAWHAELIRSLNTARPTAIVVSHKDSGVWMTGIPGNTAELLETNPGLKQLLLEQYRLETRIGAFDIYRRNSS